MSAALAFVLLLIHIVPAAGQAGGHTLLGDFKVDEKNVDAVVPLSFEVLLYTEGGHFLGRQTVVANSRYRFLNVANGRYDIVVEVEGSEVARIRVSVQSAFKTDFRQDIHLEWRGEPNRQPAKPQTVSAADFYDRPNRNKSLFEKAQRHLDNGLPVEAASLLDEIVKSDPGDFQAWTELGTTHLVLGDVAQAETAYRRAIKERPGFVLALLNLGRVLRNQKRFDESVDPLQRAIQASPNSDDAHFLLGQTYLKLKRGSKAVPHLNEAVRLNPKDKADAHLLLASLYDAAGVKHSAAVEYEKFLAKRPDYSDREKLQHYISQHRKP